MTLELPPNCIQLFPDPAGLALLDNVKPSIAIASDGTVFRLYFALLRGDDGKVVPGTAAMRVVRFAPNKRNGTLVKLDFYLNASGTFLEFGGKLYIDGYHNIYTSGHKETFEVVVPVPDVLCPCQIF